MHESMGAPWGLNLLSSLIAVKFITDNDSPVRLEPVTFRLQVAFTLDYLSSEYSIVKIFSRIFGRLLNSTEVIEAKGTKLHNLLLVWGSWEIAIDLAKSFPMMRLHRRVMILIFREAASHVWRAMLTRPLTGSPIHDLQLAHGYGAIHLGWESVELFIDIPRLLRLLHWRLE